MDENSARIESELLDLSTENVATLRSVDRSRMTAAVERVRDRIADSGQSISGYNPSFTVHTDPSGPAPEARAG